MENNLLCYFLVLYSYFSLCFVCGQRITFEVVNASTKITFLQELAFGYFLGRTWVYLFRRKQKHFLTVPFIHQTNRSMLRAFLLEFKHKFFISMARGKVFRTKWKNFKHFLNQMSCWKLHWNFWKARMFSLLKEVMIHVVISLLANWIKNVLQVCIVIREFKFVIIDISFYLV